MYVDRGNVRELLSISYKPINDNNNREVDSKPSSCNLVDFVT